MDRDPSKPTSTARLACIAASDSDIDENDFTLTHIPSGFAYLSGVTKADAEAAAREINAGDLDWSAVKTQQDVTPAHKAQGKALRAKYERVR